MLEKVEPLDLDRVIDEFEEMTGKADEVQRQTLEDILQKNKSTLYLQRCGLNGRADIADFKAMVPLVTDLDLEPYIKRMVEGDKSPILTSHPAPAISLSSGTSQGRPKFVPFTDVLMENTLQLFRTAFAFRNREFPIGEGKVLQFIFSSKQYVSEGGVPVGTATTNVYRNPKFKAGMQSIQSMCCSPDEVIFSPDVHQALYCHLLCGVICREEVQYVFAAFAHSLIHAFRTFEHVWEDIVADIRDGVLTSRVTLPSVRAAMSKLLRPNPELSDSVRTKCLSLSNWYGLIPALFPNAKYVYGIMTGSMEPYVNKLRHYAGDLPLISHDYGSSEGWIAANVTPRLPPEEAVFAVVPNFGYFEFIPLALTEEESPEPVGLTDVKVGEEYEVVLTNYAGMYRYRLGDVVKVMGFYNRTPQIKFMCRRNLMLSINIDKNTERDLQISVRAAAKRLSEEKLEVLEFSSHVDLSSEPGHYVVFWEISGEITNEDALRECCNVLDRSFLDAGYVSSRKGKTIGPLELRVVRRGTFEKVKEHYLGLGTSAGQFKMPRCVKPSNSNVLRILCECVVSRFFSTAFD